MLGIPCKACARIPVWERNERGGGEHLAFRWGTGQCMEKQFKVGVTRVHYRQVFRSWSSTFCMAYLFNSSQLSELNFFASPHLTSVCREAEAIDMTFAFCDCYFLRRVFDYRCLCCSCLFFCKKGAKHSFSVCILFLCLHIHQFENKKKR